MRKSAASREVEERYGLCLKCVGEEGVPGGECLMACVRRRMKGDPVKWYNPFYVEERPELLQPYVEGVCDNCGYADEHEVGAFVGCL